MTCAEMILEKMKRLSPEDRAQMIKYMEDLLNYQWRCVYLSRQRLYSGRRSCSERLAY